MSFDLLPSSALGQVWTPSHIANEMAHEISMAMPEAHLFLDPACGPGTFSSALHAVGFRNLNLDCFDIDNRMVKQTCLVNDQISFQGKVINEDYLNARSLAGKYDVVIMNPPYIRQELIEEKNKADYHFYLSKQFGSNIDRRSNLFALFLLKGLVDLAVGGVLCAIVYDAISQSGYGKKTLAIMKSYAEIISSKRIKAPFDGVLVDAEILMFRKRAVPVNFNTFSTSVVNNKFSKLSDLLDIRRGTCFPRRKAYIGSASDPYIKYATPLFIKQGNIDSLIVEPDHLAYLRNESIVGSPDALMWLKEKMLEHGVPEKKMLMPGISGAIAFNYYIRSAPRHLWNPKSVVLSDNFYVSTAKDGFPNQVAWLLLNTDWYLKQIVGQARNQGNGLLKLQLYEYKEVQVPNWHMISAEVIDKLFFAAQELINKKASADIVKSVTQEITKNIFNA